MNAYTLWHTRASSENNELQKFQRLQESLQNNTFTGPLYVDGTQWNKAREQAAAKLFESLESNTAVTKLFFHNATLNPVVDAALEQGWAGNTNLRQVTLRNLKSPAPSNVGNNDSSAFYKVPASLFFNHQMQSLHLAHVALNRAAAHAMAELLAHSDKLTFLHMEGIRVSDCKVWDIIAAAVAVNTSLRTVHILKQTNKGQLKSILKAFSSNKSIETLHLEDLRLDQTDATLVAPLFRHNSLQELSLRRNRFNGDALLSLMKTCGDEVAVPRIMLSRNPLGSSSSTQVMNAFRQLAKQPALRQLCLCNTQLDALTCLSILQAFGNSQVRKVGMDGNSLDECDAGAVAQAVQTSMYLDTIWDNPRMMPSHFSEVDFWLRVNSAPRRALAKQDQTDAQTIMPHLYHLAASRPRENKPDVLFYFLTQSVSMVVGQ